MTNENTEQLNPFFIQKVKIARLSSTKIPLLQYLSYSWVVLISTQVSLRLLQGCNKPFKTWQQNQAQNCHCVLTAWSTLLPTPTSLPPPRYSEPWILSKMAPDLLEVYISSLFQTSD